MEPGPATEQINTMWASQDCGNSCRKTCNPLNRDFTMLHTSLARGGDQGEDRSEQPNETIPAD